MKLNERESNSNFVIVKNCFRQDLKKVYDKSFTDLHLLILVYMQRFTAINSNTMTFTLSWLYDDLSISNSIAKQDITRAMLELENMNLIELNVLDIDKVDRNTRIIASLFDYEGDFTLIDNDAIDKILSLDIDIRQKRTMLLLYCNIASRIDDKGYCYPSFASFKADLQTTSDNRINDALELLKECKLIDYDNVGQVLIDGQVTQANNIYVLCNRKDHKARLQEGLNNRKKQYEEGKAKIFKGEQSNIMRSLKQRKNNLDKKYINNTITQEELQELGLIENDYYDMNKLNKDKLQEINFITINITKMELKQIMKRLIKLKDKGRENLTQEEMQEGKELYLLSKQLEKELGEE